MPSSLGPAEILVILVVALIVLGPKRLPEAGRQLGKTLGEIRRWSSTVQEEIRDALDLDGDSEPQPPPPAGLAPPASAAPTAPAPEPPPGPVSPPQPPAGGLPPEWAAPRRAADPQD